MNRLKRILSIAAHPDDEMLGCGGTLALAASKGDKVRSVILGQGLLSRKHPETSLNTLQEDSRKANRILGVDSTGFYELPDNAFDTVSLLSIVQIVEQEISSYSPDIIFTHYGHDLNVDHRRTFEAVLTACRPQPGFKNPDIYSFFVSSSTDWIDGNLFLSYAPNVYVDISATIERKLEALSYYRSEMKEYPHSRSIEALRIFSKYWGNRIGREYAEPFILIRKIDNVI